MKTNNQTIRNQNINACLMISNTIKSSFGPISFDKMIITELGEIFFTNDGANILKRIEVNHPASKILISLSQQQDEEVGDGTTSVILIACELLKRANDLITKKIHPSVVIFAYRLAMCYACRMIKENLCVSTIFSNFIFLNVARTSLSSKIIGFNSKKFSIIAFYAIKSVYTLEKIKNKKQCQLKAINFIKIYGESVTKSCIFDGCVLEYQKLFSNTINYISPAKLMCFNSDLKLSKLNSKTFFENQNPLEIKKIVNIEIKTTVCHVKNIIENGINLIFTTKNIDDFIVKYLIKNGIIGIKRLSGVFLKKIAVVSGLKIQNNFQNKINFCISDFIQIGETEEFFERKIASGNFMFMRGCRLCPASSIVLRGATKFLLDEVSQSLYDAMCTVKKAIETKKLITGGGSIEISLYIFLEKLANTIFTREQLGIMEFAESLLVIPKTLCKNANLNQIEIISRIKILHSFSLHYKFSEFKHFGIDLSTGQITNHLINGIIEPAINKIKCIQIATEAAITLLRIDDFIISNKEKQ